SPAPFLHPSPDPGPGPKSEPGPGPDPRPDPEPGPDPRPKSHSQASIPFPGLWALCQPLDEAFSLWKKLLENPGIPEVRSPEQTLSSLQVLAELFRLQHRPLQALQALLLLRSLCRRLGDPSGSADSLGRICRILLQLQSPELAQVRLE
ncbi:ESPL1 protein, partial [Dicaeum eximium]|nr:ESPL1 protein [Dicaeum eximium]